MANDVFFREENVLSTAQEYLRNADAASPDEKFCARLVDEYERLFRHTRRMAAMGDRMQRTLNDLNHRLADSEERYRGIFENVVEGIFRAEGSGLDARLIEANPALAAMFERPGAEGFLARYSSVGELFANESDRKCFAEQLHAEGYVRGFQAELVRPDGERFWAELSVSLSADTAGSEDSGAASLFGLVADISERRRMLEEIYRLARTDALTGLWNRGYFMERARQELARCRRDGLPASLVMVDADHFKRVNDTHGHEAGDDALRCLAQVLTASVREVDLVARLGGEEFVLLLPGVRAPGAMAMANRICRGIRSKRLRCTGGACFCLTVSLGVASSPDAGQSLAELLRNADMALYSAKNSGRDRVECCEGAA